MRMTPSVLLLAAALGTGAVAASDDGRDSAQRSAIVFVSEPTLIGSTIVQGPVLFVHDRVKMARGEPCTSVRLFVPGSGPSEEIAAFHCIPRWGKAPRRFTLTTQPNVALGFGCVLTAYQFAGDPEIHGVPAPAVAD
jgi:hypothetical protein